MLFQHMAMMKGRKKEDKIRWCSHENDRTDIGARKKVLYVQISSAQNIHVGIRLVRAAERGQA